MSALRRRYGRTARPSLKRGSRGTFAVVSDGYYNSHRTYGKAIDEAEYLEARGYEPIVYEFTEAHPERHRLILHGPGKWQIAPPYKKGR